MLQRLPSGEPELVWSGAYYARFIKTGRHSGHLVYISRGALFAVPFDLDSLKVRGQPVPVVPEVVAQNGDGQSAAHFDLSSNGTLVYAKGSFQKQLREFEWVSPSGTNENLGLPPGEYGSWFHLSPDGKSLVYDRNDRVQSDIWVFDIERKTPMQITFDPGNDMFPVWSPNGTHIAFASDRQNGTRAIYSVRSDGGEEKLVFVSTNALGPWAWHPKEPCLAISEFIPGSGISLNILSLEGDDRIGWKGTAMTNFIAAEFGPMDVSFSPNGRWLAYSSGGADGRQVFVQRFSEGGGKKRISNINGQADASVWITAKSGPQLVFQGNEGKASRLFRTEFSEKDGTFTHDQPVPWEEITVENVIWGRTWDVHPDGRVLRLKHSGDGSQERIDHVVVFENFAEYLRQQVPNEEN